VRDHNANDNEQINSDTFLGSFIGKEITATVENSSKLTASILVVTRQTMAGARQLTSNETKNEWWTTLDRVTKFK
jgi:hypothetical protein